MPEPEYVFSRDYLDNNRIFLTDLSRRLPPSVQLDAFDISFEAMPPKELLPNNMNLHKWDIKRDIPKEFEGIYDIVHVRMLIFVLLDDEIESALSNLLKLLKPGGYLQWADVDVHSVRIEKTDPQNSTSALENILQMARSADSRLTPHWIPKLPTLFEERGLKDVVADVRDAPGYMAYTLHECVLMVYDMMSQKAEKEEAAQNQRKIFSAVLKETKDGGYQVWTRWTVIGRKPE